MANQEARIITPSLQRLSDEEIAGILEEHLKWTQTRGKEGLPANFDGKNLVGANLRGAYLAQATLQSTQLMAANLEGANLIAANLKNAFLGEAILRYAKLQSAELQGAYLVEADLEKADLDGADLRGAFLTKANIRGAKLRGANFANADVTQIKYNRFGGYQGIRVENCHGCARFRRLAEDQGYLEELRNSGWLRKVTYLLWLVFADCGRSLILWSVWSVLFAVLFGLKYFSLGPESFDVARLPWNRATTIYYSVVTFTTLGFGDIVPKTNEAAWWVLAEVIVGYVMLGGLVSIFATKIARRR